MLEGCKVIRFLIYPNTLRKNFSPWINHTHSEAFKAFSESGKLKAVYTNHDYEPYAIARDAQIKELLAGQGISFHSFKEASWNDPEEFERWQKGMTGFPLVDAGMRELSATGFMHNRVRMVTASFLVKDLLIDWRWVPEYDTSDYLKPMLDHAFERERCLGSYKNAIQP